MALAALTVLPSSSWFPGVIDRADARQVFVRVQPLKPLKFNNDEYKLHEWGVFPIARDAAWAKQDMLAEWQTFPKFFRGNMPGRKLFSPSEIDPPQIMTVRKPVVFIHNLNQTAIDMKVTFPKGRPVVWWPPAIEPASPAQAKATKHLRFKFVATGSIGKNLPTGLPLQTIPYASVDADHWLNHLRDVECSRITVTGGKIPRSPSNGFAEKFIYYDGVSHAPKSPIARREKDTVILQSTSDHDWHDVLVIERIDGRARVSNWIDKLAAGTNETTISFTDITRNEATARSSLQSQLLKRLTSAGLYKDEANALVKVWAPGLFEQDGLLLFYRAPQKTYDTWLPLELTPKPTNMVRVGLVVHSHLEPELESRVTKLIDKLASEDYQTRINADKNLRRIGGAAFKWIHLGAKSKDAEVAARCQGILKEYDAGQFVMDPSEKAKAPTPRVRKQ